MRKRVSAGGASAGADIGDLGRQRVGPHGARNQFVADDVAGRAVDAELHGQGLALGERGRDGSILEKRAQASYLKTLSEEAGEPFDDSLTKADASKRIDALQEKTGRGQ